MTSSALAADYVDLKFIKGRKCAQIILEIPIEAANAFVQAFGTPSPATGVPVALARLQTAKEQQQTAKLPRKMSELPLPQQAALLCDREAFKRYIAERFNADDPAAFIRSRCGVATRADIHPGSPAAEKFYQIQADYDVWMRAA